MENKVYVTAPSLAPLNEFVELLEGVWESGILTHNGPLVQRLEKALSSKLGLERLSLVTNGTIALQMAIKALDLRGEIITTPFTWIATLSAIQWEGCTPVFCDVEEDTFNIDCTKIEDLITDKTVAIMPVHVFGNPCDVYEIERIAKKYNLKVIYDAAHAVGSTLNGKSLLAFGDISATSLHATKLLNTGEGGALIAASDDLDNEISKVRFFGHNENKHIVRVGTNGKMTEIHAALGLANLKYFDEVLTDRKQKYLRYQNSLENLAGIKFQTFDHGEINYSYFPIVLESESHVLQVIDALGEINVVPRRYFYPSVNLYSAIVPYQECPVSENLASRILCLPLYYQLKIEEIDRITSVLKLTIN